MNVEAHNFLIAAPNLADTAVLSGGTWVAPLANLQTRPLKQVARSASADPDDTVIDVDLARWSTIRAVGLVAHNLTRAARVRLVAYQDAARTEVRWDSGWLPVWTRVWPSRSMEWRHPRWWSGVPADDEQVGVTPTWVQVIQGVSARYWRWLIDDPRPSGLVEVGRLVMARGWQPQFNASMGCTIGVDDRTEISELEDGGEIAEERPRRRVVTFSLDHLSEDEAVSVLLYMQRTLGTWGEVLFCMDPTSTRYVQPLSMWCRFQQLQPITKASCIQYTNPIALIEIAREST